MGCTCEICRPDLLQTIIEFYEVHSGHVCIGKSGHYAGYYEIIGTESPTQDRIERSIAHWAQYTAKPGQYVATYRHADEGECQYVFTVAQSVHVEVGG